jgi:hypothetical protein
MRYAACDRTAIVKNLPADGDCATLCITGFIGKALLPPVK